MATETLRPNATGDECNIDGETGAACPNHYQNVDEVVTDEETTRVYTLSVAVFLRDLYNIEDHSVGTGTINHITVYARCKRAANNPRIKIAIKANVTVDEDIEIQPDGVYTNYSKQWALNPDDAAAWEWADIDALQIGIALKGGGAGGWAFCTQIWVVVDYTVHDHVRTLSTSIGLAPTLTRGPTTFGRSLDAAIGLTSSLNHEALNRGGWLCIASRDGGSTKTMDDGANWSVCAQNAAGALAGAWFAQYLNRLCVLNYERIGFSFSDPHDIVADWTNKPDFPNFMQRFTELFVGRDAGDDPVLSFLTHTGMYYLDVFANFVFGPTELMWEEDGYSGKKGLYWKGEHYVAVGKGIYKISRGEVDLVGPDMDDGVPENLQGVITDMIGIGFWLVIAVNGGVSKKSCIMKRYISGKHWHPVYIGSLNTPIQALCWDSGTLYFGEGTDVKSLPFPNVTDNVKQLTDHHYCATGDLIYPYFHSIFEAMLKVAHKVWATTQDCNTAGEKITISYRVDEDTAWTELGSFESSPRPEALPFPAAGDSIGVEFERIQFKAAFARRTTDTTLSPKMESLILEYRVTPPVLWGWDVRVLATTSGDRRGQDIIDALIDAIEEPKLLSFYPSGDKSETEYFVEVKGMPGVRKGTAFGEEGTYDLTVEEVIEE